MTEHLTLLDANVDEGQMRHVREQLPAELTEELFAGIG